MLLLKFLNIQIWAARPPFFKNLFILTDNNNNNFARFVEYELYVG
jgi:hypothetical protein